MFWPAVSRSDGHDTRPVGRLTPPGPAIGRGFCGCNAAVSLRTARRYQQSLQLPTRRTCSSVSADGIEQTISPCRDNRRADMK
jgi:hypothetical protein